jgi:1-acyl-sn-glycerol-3-phosphate acyltransferase
VKKIIIGILGLLYKLYIGFLFSVFLIICVVPINLLKRSPKTIKSTFHVFRFWSWMMRIFGGIIVVFNQRVKLPKGPYIIVSNHSSYFDIFLMYSIMQQEPFLFLGKSEILRYPLVSSFFKNLNIPVYRKDKLKAAKSFVHAKQALANGWSLVVFPEGGIPDDDLPKMKPFKEGAFKLAKSCKVPIVPITFLNNYKLFSDPDQLLGEAHPGVCQVVQHPIIDVSTIESMTVEELMDFTYTLLSKPFHS